MNINDYIKDLSIKDTKNLSQKGLKLVEEVGELARAILPYDSAPGTNHRFVDRENILEEVVDVYLTNISILHSLGFTDEEFNEMLIRKSEKWGRIQSKEEEAKFPLPFEIHITISIDRPDFIDDFRQDCKQINVKPIVLDLEVNNESPIKDVMTSSKHFGDNRTAYEESERISSELISLGYTVVRKKIETVPWHPAAPTTKTGEPIPNSCYFESHIGVLITPDLKEVLQEFVNDLNNGNSELGSVRLGGTIRLSQNFFKKSKDGSEFINILTYRDSMTCRTDFEKDIETIKSSLKASSFGFEKVEVEYAIYDTNTNHDSKWLFGKK